MKIAITGAAGLVGSYFTFHFAAEHVVRALSHRDLDVTDRQAVRRWCANERPDLVINCAVLGVDACERDPALAHAINVTAPEGLALAASAAGAELLHFSTNYVFDGMRTGGGSYTLDDDARPINEYGRTKLAGERAVRTASARTFIIRSSWVYGPGKQSFLSVAHRHLLAGKPLRAVTDIWANTTYVADLAARVSEILARGRYGTYQIVNPGVCSYYEFAAETARLIGLSAEKARQLIEPVRVADAGWLAPRPRYTPMHCRLSEELGLAPMRDWHAALAAYVRSDLPAAA